MSISSMERCTCMLSTCSDTRRLIWTSSVPAPHSYKRQNTISKEKRKKSQSSLFNGILLLLLQLQIVIIIIIVINIFKALRAFALRLRPFTSPSQHLNHMQLPVADWRRVTAKWSEDKNHEVMKWYFLHVGFPQLVHCSSQVSSSFRLACECCQVSSVHYFVITSRRLASRLEPPQPKKERNVGQGKKERTSDTIIRFEQIKCLTGFTQLDWLAFSFVFVICFFNWTSGATVH